MSVNDVNEWWPHAYLCKVITSRSVKSPSFHSLGWVYVCKAWRRCCGIWCLENEDLSVAFKHISYWENAYNFFTSYMQRPLLQCTRTNISTYADTCKTATFSSVSQHLFVFVKGHTKPKSRRRNSIQNGGPGQEHGHPWQLVQNCFCEVDHWWAKGVPGHILCCFHHSSGFFRPLPVTECGEQEIGVRSSPLRIQCLSFFFRGSGAESGPKSMRENAYPTKSNILNTNLRPIQVERDF